MRRKIMWRFIANSFYTYDYLLIFFNLILFVAIIDVCEEFLNNS